MEHVVCLRLFTIHGGQKLPEATAGDMIFRNRETFVAIMNTQTSVDVP